MENLFPDPRSLERSNGVIEGSVSVVTTEEKKLVLSSVFHSFYKSL